MPPSPGASRSVPSLSPADAATTTTPRRTSSPRGSPSAANIEVTVVQQGGSTTDAKIPLYEKDDWAKGYDVVLHDECFADVKDPSWTARILAPHKAGLPGVVIHCAMHCYRDGTDEWFKFCGVTSRGHGAGYPHEVLNVDPKHPVMKAFGPAWANPAGELYWIEKVWPTAHPLATSKNRENGHDEACVWTNQYGKAARLRHDARPPQRDRRQPRLPRPADARHPLGLRHARRRPPQAGRRAGGVPVDLARGPRRTASSEEAGKGNLAGKAVDGDPAHPLVRRPTIGAPVVAGRPRRRRRI